MKSIEMSVLRCIQLIEEFDKLERGEDWTSVPMSRYRSIYGKTYFEQKADVIEVWKRYKDGTIYRQILEWFENLPSKSQKRKELKSGIRRIRKAVSD